MCHFFDFLHFIYALVLTLKNPQNFVESDIWILLKRISPQNGSSKCNGSYGNKKCPFPLRRMHFVDVDIYVALLVTDLFISNILNASCRLFSQHFILKSRDSPNEKCIAWFSYKFVIIFQIKIFEIGPSFH